MSPNSPKVHILLGDSYREGERFAEAEAEYRKAIQISPEDFAAHFGLAMTFYQNFKIDQAETELRTVMGSSPMIPTPATHGARPGSQTAIRRRQTALGGGAEGKSQQRTPCVCDVGEDRTQPRGDLRKPAPSSKNHLMLTVMAATITNSSGFTSNSMTSRPRRLL